MEDGKRKWRKELMEEVKKESRIAGPMIGVSVLQYMVQVSTVIMVGHLGKFELSSVAIATSLTNVSGFSLLSGMAGGLETLCGQAYGAQQYHKLGIYTYTSIISLLAICPPICLLWAFMPKFLPLIGQDPAISHQASKYSIFLIPALLGSAILKPLTRFLQTQSVVLPMLLSSVLVLCFHVVVCWILVYKVEMGIVGAALAVGLSTWLNVGMLGMYVRCSTICQKTRCPLSREAFHGIPQFFRLGVPSAVMICLKWWSMEIIILLSGLLPNPQLQTSVLSICLTISTLHFTIPYGLGAATSTRVSNELGRGNPQSARMSVIVGVSMAATEAVVVCAIIFSCRHVVGKAYSSDKQVVSYVASMAPFLCLSLFMDTFQAVLSGVARGCGWQRVGAYVNVGAFYVVGLPISVVLGFVAHLRAKGLWIGIVVGSLLQSILLFSITASTDWTKQVEKARARVCGGKSSVEDEEMKE